MALIAIKGKEENPRLILFGAGQSGLA